MAPSNNNYISIMLDWCRNLHPAQDTDSELTLIAANAATQPPTTRNLIPPKFADPNSQRRLNSESRKGIKTHFGRSFKVDRETQTTLQEQSKMDCSTQTIAISIHPIGSRRGSLACSPNPSPSKQMRSNTYKGEVCMTQRTNFLEVSKGTVDYKTELNKETKASCNMLESQEKAFRFEDRSYHNVKNVDSYHLPGTAKTLAPIYPPAFMKNRLPHKPPHSQQRLVESIRNTISEEESNAFS
jgi:hypothetical protein